MTQQQHYINLQDRSVFNEIFDRYQPGLLGMAIRMLGSREDAEDVITETFFKLWQAGGEFANLAAVGGWLRVTTRNQCLNFLKQYHLQQGRFLELTAQQEAGDYFEQEELLAELLKEVYAAMNALPEKSREVFRLRYVEGLKNEEIAGRLGIRYQSVRNHLSTALKQLRLVFLNRPDLLSVLILLEAFQHDHRLF